MTESSLTFTRETVNSDALYRQLEQGRLVITANSRLARVLRGQYTAWQQARGEQQWGSPAVLAWAEWIEQCWERAALSGASFAQAAVPGPHALHSLWEQALSKDELARSLLQEDRLASDLAATRRLVREWMISMEHPAWQDSENENALAFSRWNAAFERYCSAHGWLPPEDRLALLAKHQSSALQAALAIPGNAVALLGFDELAPMPRNWLNALEQQGCQIAVLAPEPLNRHATLWKCESAEQELDAMARWVRYQYEEDPGASIAVVVEGLQARRNDVERHLARVLTPTLPIRSDHPPWNLSLGKPLADYPLVRAAFNLFRLLNYRVDIQAVGSVLRSPWLRGAMAERNSRALLEKCLREKYQRQLKLSEVRWRAREHVRFDDDGQELPEDLQTPQEWNSPVMAQIIQALIDFQSDNAGNRAPSAWADALDALLNRAGWPGRADSDEAEPHSSEDWQAHQKWQEALRQFAALDTTIAPLNLSDAVRRLRQICVDTVFQPKTPPTSIQVMGLLEAGGLQFDHLWVLGLHNGNWPPAARPNPYIPLELQRKLQIQHATPERELHFAHQATQRLIQSAPDIVFSYPGLVDNEEALPSPLLKHLPALEPPAWSGQTWARAQRASAGTESIPLESPGAVDAESAKGGSSILKHQALCPFRAFASSRLGAKGLETPVDGISPALHGSLLHEVLEGFWKQTRTQAALLDLGDSGCLERVQAHVERVLSDDRSLMNRPEFLQVEAERLKNLVMRHLELEKQRTPFEVIGFEREILHEIEGKTIRLVIDRVDQLPGGEEIIIDYKTGKVTPSKWFGDRPEDPQLPLYAISSETTPSAVAFAVLRDDECVYKGVVRHDELLPGLPPQRGKGAADLRAAGEELSHTVENWRSVLHGLMAAFLRGEAEIDPLRGTPTCASSYCEFQSLCRVDELERLQRRESYQ